ncbi:MAG: mandelate racemase/muconate lactonizing enzyme family protein [Beijerinckiaceae bacterium]
MKITSVRTCLFEKPMDGTFRNPRFAWTAKRSLLTFVETDAGLIGVGESWADGGDPASISSFIERDLAPALIGQDPRLPERHFRRALDLTQTSTRRSQTWAAMSAIDIALWDIKSQAAGEPLWRMLGGHDPRVRPYASGGLYREGQSVDDFAREYAGYVRAGYGAVKIKVGGAPLPVDVERVAKLREAMGADAKLMVDAVSNYDVPTAIAFARAVQRYDITWFEQPLAIEDVAGMAKVQREGGIPLCGIENDYTLASFRRLVEADAVHFVQFDPVISGGITYGRKIAALAEAFFRPVTLHHSNSIVSMMANIHLAASLPNAHSVELHVIHQPLFDCARAGAMVMTDGMLTAPEGPGLGVDARALREHGSRVD